MIIRSKKNKNFSVISNVIFRDKNISARAKGIFAYIMTLPDDWKLYKSELYTHFSEGEKAIDTAFKELEEFGYITKEKYRNKNNQFVGWNYTIIEISPITATIPETPISDLSETRKSGNRPVGKGGLLNTNRLNTKELNINRLNTQFEKDKSFSKPPIKDITKDKTTNNNKSIIQEERKENSAKEKKEKITNKNIYKFSGEEIKKNLKYKKSLEEHERKIGMSIYRHIFFRCFSKKIIPSNYKKAIKWCMQLQSFIISDILPIYDDIEIKEILDYIENDEFWKINFTHINQFEKIRVAMQKNKEY